MNKKTFFLIILILLLILAFNSREHFVGTFRKKGLTNYMDLYSKAYFKDDVKAIDSRVYYAYMRDATKFDDPKLNTHSDDFGSSLGHGGGYRHVYYKTAAMLYNLQYVLGDELFLEAMKNYFNTWKIAHPYNEDFKKSIIQFTKVDLNWFFDQWLDTKKRIDYSVKVKGNDIIFKRKSRMQMPIDFRVCLLYTSPSPRDKRQSRMPSSA